MLEILLGIGAVCWIVSVFVRALYKEYGNKHKKQNNKKFRYYLYDSINKDQYYDYNVLCYYDSKKIEEMIIDNVSKSTCASYPFRPSIYINTKCNKRVEYGYGYIWFKYEWNSENGDNGYFRDLNVSFDELFAIAETFKGKSIKELLDFECEKTQIN